MKIIQKTLELIKRMLLVAVIVLIIFGPIKYGPILIKHIYSYIVRPPVSAEDYLIRGDKYFNEGKKTEALKDYNKAFELDPSYSGKYEHSVSRLHVYAMNSFKDAPNDLKAIFGTGESISLINGKKKQEAYKAIKDILGNNITDEGISPVDKKRDIALYNILKGHVKKSDNMNSYTRTTYPSYLLLKILRIF